MDNLEMLIKGTPDWHNIVNNNFNMVKSSVENLDMGQASATVVVAPYNSTNKDKADYVVPQGAVNAQETIKSALYSLPDSGGRIILLEGTYIVNGEIFESDGNITIEGMGASTIIKANTTFTGNAIFTNGNNDTNNVIIKNLVIDCSKVADGIDIYKSINSSIENVKILNPLGTGLALNLCSNIKIINNIFLSDGSLDNRAFNLTGNPNHELVISNNVISGFETGMYISQTSNSIISNNIIANNFIEGINLSYSVVDNIITQNIFNKNGYEDSGSDTCHIKLTGGNYNLIQNNMFRKGKTGTVGVDTMVGIRIGSSCTGNMLTNNDMYDASLGYKIIDNGTGTVTTSGNRGV